MTEGIIHQRIDDMITEAIYRERQRCADVAAIYPTDGFAYDTNDTGVLLRLRDSISEAILKGSLPGRMIA